MFCYFHMKAEPLCLFGFVLMVWFFSECSTAFWGNEAYEIILLTISAMSVWMCLWISVMTGDFRHFK